LSGQGHSWKKKKKWQKQNPDLSDAEAHFWHIYQATAEGKSEGQSGSRFVCTFRSTPIGLQNIGFNMFFMASCLIFSLGYFFRFKMDVYKDRQNSQKMTKNNPWIYLIEPYTLPLSS